MESESPTPAQEIETSTSESLTSHKCDWITLIQGVRFTSNGRYVCGFVDSGQELMQVLETYRTMSGTGFINAQTLSAAMKTIDDTIWQTRFMSPVARPRLFWQMSAGEPHIPYDGVPLMSIGQNTELPCVRYGGRRKKVETVALATGDLINMDYRQKTGCEAKITIRRIMRFPSAQVTDLSQQGVAAVRRMRKQLLEDLTQKIIAGIAKPMERYYFLLPTPLAHTTHLVPEMEAAPAIVQLVSDEIINQLSHGITEITLIRDHIKNFTDSTFGTEAALHADNPAYYPTEVGIYHHIYWMYKLGQVIDQESAFKAKLALSDDRAISASPLSLTSTSSPNKLPVTSDTITSVYSIIMDEATAAGSALDLNDSGQIHQTEQEVELNTTTDPLPQTEEELPIPHSLSHSQIAPPSSTSTSLSSLTPIAIPSMSAMSVIAKRGIPPSKLLNITPVSSLSNMTVGGRGGGGRMETESHDPIVSQAQSEVRDMLRIIENQTHACRALPALNMLRRQLTELCSQFSMHLAGVPTKSFGGLRSEGGGIINSTPPIKRAKLS